MVDTGLVSHARGRKKKKLATEVASPLSTGAGDD